MRKSFVSKPVEPESTSLQEGMSSYMQNFSAWGSARFVGQPVNKMHKILRSILHCYPDRTNHVKELFPANLPVKHSFSL